MAGTIRVEHRLASQLTDTGWGARRLFKSRWKIEQERTCGPSWFRLRMESLPPERPGDSERLETMGYTIRPIAANAPTVVEVPDEVAKDLAGLWEYLQENPEYVASATFDTAEEVDAFLAQAKSWAAQHDPILEARRLYAGKSAPATFLKFSIRPPLTDEEKAEIRAKNEAAKAKREAAQAKGKGK